jgi:tetratricopeptide (TPR) repeat protein
VLSRRALAAGIIATFSSSVAAARHRRRRPAPPRAPTVAAAAPPVPAERLPEAVHILDRSYKDEAAGRPAAALAALEALSPGDRQTYLVSLRTGWLLYCNGRHAESIAAYTKALGREPASIEARLGRLLPRMALRQWAAVEAGAREAVEIDPASYLGGLRLAFAVYNQGRFTEAEAIYRRALARYPSDADLRAGVAWCLLKAHQPAEARRMFLEALASAPQSTTSLSGLAACDPG